MGEGAERWEAARTLLASAGDAAPVVLHRGWMAWIAGEPVEVAGLDAGVPAKVLRGLATGRAEDEAELADLHGAPAAVARARIALRRGDVAGMESALADALAAAPASEPVHRARIALRLVSGGDVDAALSDWASQDPDHVAAVGFRGERDLPWRALAPERWGELAQRRPDARMRADAPVGTDTVGERIRSARALPTAAARADALALIAQDVPGLDGLVRERYLAVVEHPAQP